MPTFAQLQRAAFSGIAYPVVSVEIQGGIRDHLHEYPHAEGAAVEKLGRKLYTIKMDCLFHTSFPAYPNLWPRSLGQLRKLYEDQTTDDLVIPTLGTIRAYCRTWSEVATSKHSSGVNASFEFVEDMETAASINNLVSVNTPQVASLSAGLADVAAARKALDDFGADKSSESLFDQIQDLGNSIISVGDQLDAYGNLLESKLLGLSSLIDQFTRGDFAQDFAHFDLTDAMHNLWDVSNEIADNLKANQVKPQVYYTETTMAMSAISIALYKDTAHSVELMQLNAVEDPWAIPAGTPIRYYPVT